MEIPTQRTGTPPGGRPAVTRPQRSAPPARTRRGGLRKFFVAVGLVVAGVIGVAGLWVVWWLAPHTLAWREAIALQDGRTVLVSRTTVMERRGEMFGQIEAKRALRVPHPETGETITWENEGKLGSRLLPILLDFDQGHAYLVIMAQSVADYNDLGCPTPPYIVFRYAAATWTRIPLAELPVRFEAANLLKYVDVDLIKRSQYVLTAAQIDAAFSETRARSDTRHYAIIDRRIRNPLSLGCGWTDKVYGPGSYTRMKGTGTWLNRTEAEALKLLWGDRNGAKP